MHSMLELSKNNGRMGDKRDKVMSLALIAPKFSMLTVEAKPRNTEGIGSPLLSV